MTSFAHCLFEDSVLAKIKKMSFASRMRSVCPLLIPLDADGLLYDGFIRIYDEEHRFKLVLPPGGELADARLEGDLTLKNALAQVCDVVQQRLKDSASLPDFMLELQAILENQLKKSSSTHSSISKPPRYYSLVIDELTSAGWHRLVHVDPLLNEVHVKFVDQESREHIVKLEFPDEYPEKCPIASVDLPIPFEINWTKEQGQTLESVLQQYERVLILYQSFWNLLEDVDRHMWVLDPEQPCRSDVSRRVALGNCSSLIFTVNPLNPSAIPTWQLLGNFKIVESLKESLNSNLESKWNENLSLVENWRNLLRIDIPSRMTNKIEDIQADCAICYSYKLEGEIPEASCIDTRCKQTFHAVCLHEWLKSAATSRVSFNVIFGECPQCSQAITCKIPQS